MTGEPQSRIDDLDPKSTEYTERLLHCMESRLALLRSMQALGRAQAEAAVGNDINVTLGVLARKQALLEDLAEINERLVPYFEDDPEERVWSSPDRRDLCREIASECQRLLQIAIQVDRTTVEEISNRRDAIAAQLQDGSDSILAHTAYTAGANLNGGELDIGGV